MKQYPHNIELTITTSTQMLPHILQATEDCAQIVKVVPITSSHEQTPKHPYANGIRDKGITGHQLALQLLSDGEKHLDFLKKKFVAHGFAASSAYAYIAKLKAAGKVEKVSVNTFKLSV